MAYPHLSAHVVEDTHVCRISYGESENWINYNFIEKLTEILENIQTEYSGKRSFVVFGGDGKFFSNGLDVQLLMENPTKMLLDFHKLLLKILTFPIPTIAAINGHAFAGGAMLAMCCDYRVMNSHRGFLCVNEVDIGLPLTPGMYAVLRAKANRDVWTEMMLGGVRFSGQKALDRRIVNDIAEPDKLMDHAMKIGFAVASKGTNPENYGCLKQQIYSAEIDMLENGGIGFAQIVADKMSKL